MEISFSTMLLQSAFSFIACYGYSIVCNAPRRELVYCGINGFLGWFVYLLMYVYVPGQHAVMATLVSTMVVTAIARFLSYHREAPSILYHIPGILPLVPGAAVYNTMQSGFVGNILETYSYALSGFKLAGAIGIGSLLILVLPYSAFEIIPRRGDRKKQAKS